MVSTTRPGASAVLVGAPWRAQSSSPANCSSPPPLDWHNHLRDRERTAETAKIQTAARIGTTPGAGAAATSG
jgi:hypothetical protein